MLDIYIDADACPVKDEVYRVARRYKLQVILVANNWMNHPGGAWVRLGPFLLPLRAVPAFVLPSFVLKVLLAFPMTIDH